MSEGEYAGFWIRFAATLIDTIILLMLIMPALVFVYGTEYWLSDSFVVGFWDVIINYLLPAIAVVLFWVYKSATPGKMATRLTIVDADTGEKPSTGQFVLRYLGYYVSTLALCLGFIWVGIDRRKQGWHDKIAGTVVIRRKRSDPVRFEGHA
jgi:uncharacterized RDD family membrane protein YckC